MKKEFTIILFCVCTILTAQTTKINFNSKSDVPVFQIEKSYIEAPKTLTLSVNVAFSSMKLLGIAPFQMEIDNGEYVFNIGGYEEYNKSFVIKANGKEKDVNILGDAQKAKNANYWALGMGLVFTLSLQTISPLISVLP